MQSKVLVLVILLVLAGVSCSHERNNATPGTNEDSASAAHDVYTCPMHPSVVSDKPGSCPVCGMTLVRKSGPPQTRLERAKELSAVSLSPTQRVLANIATATARMENIASAVSMVGVVQFAEPRQAAITARFAGRVERLFVNSTGAVVRKGDPLVVLHSPELAAAEQDYILAVDAGDRQDEMRNAAYDRLHVHFGMTPEQIAAIAERHAAGMQASFSAPITGTVVAKNVQEGEYVSEGTVLYQLVDLSIVWVQADVYESDLQRVKTGSAVMMHADAFPGKTLHGRIIFAEPILDQTTRAARVRIELANKDGLLKPGMFVRAEASSSMQKVLVVPSSAVLSTGRRDVVWVEREPNVFEPREVTVGVRTDSLCQILRGVDEGESIVRSGGFLIDSESQLQQTMAGQQDGAEGMNRHD